MNESEPPMDRPQVDWAAVLHQAQLDQSDAQIREYVNERDALLQRLAPHLSDVERDSIIELYADDARGTRDAIVAGLIEADTNPSADLSVLYDRLMDGLFSLFAQGWIAAVREHGVLDAEEGG